MYELNMDDISKRKEEAENTLQQVKVQQENLARAEHQLIGRIQAYGELLAIDSEAAVVTKDDTGA